VQKNLKAVLRFRESIAPVSRDEAFINFLKVAAGINDQRTKTIIIENL